MKLAARLIARGDFQGMIDYYAGNLPRMGVKLEFGREGTADEIASAGFDHVVVAVGGAANETLLPTEPGCVPVVTSTQVIRGEVFPGRRVVVIGGSYIGVETARLLSRQGALSPEQLFHLTVNRAESQERLGQLVNTSARQVTLVEKGPKVGFGYESGTGWPALGDLGRLGVKLMKQTLVTAIGPGGVLCQVTDKEGNVTNQTIECDTVVVATGVHPDDSLAQALREKGAAVSVAGNAAQLGRAIAAIKSGAAAGCAV
jgi:2,4-dienoyl-CoA reductase (NADPH2)